MPHLLLLPPLTMFRAPSGRYVLTRKFLDGLAAYAHYFPGKVTALLAVDPIPTTDLDHTEFDPKQHAFSIEPLPATPEALTPLLRQASIVLGSLCFDSDVRLTELCHSLGVPIVLITEYALETRRQIIAVTTSNPLKRLKRSFATGQLEKSFRRAITLASGIQCNGTPTWDDYHTLNPRTLLFFDTRIRHPMLPDRARIQSRLDHMLARHPLRLAFSGRLITMKGADALPFVARDLAALGVPFTLDICGAGELEPTLAAIIADFELSNSIRLRGNLDFATQLVPLITDQCDLFIQCHPQGDPSCTYLETMACATPIAGYNNAAFRGIAATSKTGFPTPLNNPGQLAAQIATLHNNRPQLAAGALASLNFATDHTFEKTMQARVDHLLICQARTMKSE